MAPPVDWDAFVDASIVEERQRKQAFGIEPPRPQRTWLQRKFFDPLRSALVAFFGTLLAIPLLSAMLIGGAILVGNWLQPKAESPQQAAAPVPTATVPESTSATPVVPTVKRKVPTTIPQPPPRPGQVAPLRPPVVPTPTISSLPPAIDEPAKLRAEDFAPSRSLPESKPDLSIPKLSGRPQSIKRSSPQRIAPVPSVKPPMRPGYTWVDAHTRSDGTRVKGHWRKLGKD